MVDFTLEDLRAVASKILARIIAELSPHNNTESSVNTVSALIRARELINESNEADLD